MRLKSIPKVLEDMECNLNKQDYLSECLGKAKCALGFEKKFSNVSKHSLKCIDDY